MNKQKNKIGYNRFAIVISSKSVNTNVERNFFRRRFFDMISEKKLITTWYDLVFVVKNKVKLWKKIEWSFASFSKDLKFLLGKIW